MQTQTLIRHLTGCFLVLLVLLGCSPAAQPSETIEASPAPTSAADNPTTGAIVRSTREAQQTQDRQATATELAARAATATAEAADLATQIAEARANATATIVARYTAAAIATVQPTWPNLLRESFADNHLAWPVTPKQDDSLSINSAIAAGRYQWTVRVEHGNSYFNLVPEKSPSLADFSASATLQFVQGNDEGEVAYGLVFRQNENDYGFFGIQKNGDFRVMEVHHSGIYQDVIGSSYAIDVLPEHTNRLTVIAVGSDFVFLINNQVVGQMNADIAPGKIGLGVDALTRANEAQVEFTDFEISAPAK
jgi:hypothetical protein